MRWATGGQANGANIINFGQMSGLCWTEWPRLDDQARFLYNFDHADNADGLEEGKLPLSLESPK